MAKKDEVKTKIWYLEMLVAPAYPDFKNRRDCTIKKLVKPSLDVYKKLYDAVGSNWKWYDRKLMREEELLSIIQNPKVEIWLLLINSKAASISPGLAASSPAPSSRRISSILGFVLAFAA